MKRYTRIIVSVQTILRILMLYMAAGLISCESDEFIPPAEGEQVPYEENNYADLKVAVEESAGELYRLAYQRSGMQQLLDSLGRDRSEFTLFLLSDAALQAAGYDRAAIEAATPGHLDSLLRFHTLRNRITAEDLNWDDNYQAQTLLLRTPGTTVYAYHRHFLQLRDGRLYVNGKVQGMAQPVPATNGYLYHIEQVIDIPDRDILDVLEEDGRFSLFVGILKATDAQYLAIYRTGVNNPDAVHNLRNTTESTFSLRFGWEVVGATERPSANRTIYDRTLFIPTDEAFHAAGFQTLDDLHAFNTDRGLPTYASSSANTHLTGIFFATDSLLDYHINWGQLYDYTWANNRKYLTEPIHSLLVYSNVLDDHVAGNYVASFYNQTTGTTGFYTKAMPFEFSQNASGQAQVRVKGSDAPWATVVDGDINTRQGPVHAVDRLLLPAGYKLDN